MANRTHIATVLAGSAAIDIWRRKHPSEVFNLRNADLHYADLRGADLRGANLLGAHLGGADLGGADLRGAYLGYAYLRKANLSGANLRKADLRGAYLRGAYLRGAKHLDDASIAEGISWSVYLSEVVPALLTAGGHTLEEVAAHWECHSWDNCPIAAAFDCHDIYGVPPSQRARAAEFVVLFDSGLVPNPLARTAETETEPS